MANPFPLARSTGTGRSTRYFNKAAHQRKTQRSGLGWPQTNGVAERFNRTLKEQAINGRIFKNLDEVRRAVAIFVERYNAEWLVEKLGFVSPSNARETFTLRS